MVFVAGDREQGAYAEDFQQQQWSTMIYRLRIQWLYLDVLSPLNASTPHASTPHASTPHASTPHASRPLAAYTRQKPQAKVKNEDGSDINNDGVVTGE